MISVRAARQRGSEKVLWKRRDEPRVSEPRSSEGVPWQPPSSTCGAMRHSCVGCASIAEVAQQGQKTLVDRVEPTTGSRMGKGLYVIQVLLESGIMKKCDVVGGK